MRYSTDRGTRLYVFLLRAYPRVYRQAYGEELADVFADLWREVRAQERPRPRLRFWLSCLFDLTRNVPLAWAACGWSVLGLPGGSEPPPRRRGLRPRASVLGWIRDAGQDARVGTRTFARRPATSLSAVAALALGIGGVTAVFSAVEGILLRPLPYAESDRLVRIWQNNQDPNTGTGSATFAVTPAQYHGWRAESRALEDIVAFSMFNGSFGQEDDFPLPGVYGSVTWNFFGFLGVEAALGRTFAAQDEPESPRAEVALLSHAFWRQSFGAEPAALGRDVVINGVPYRVVGVLPPDFRWYEYLGEEPLVWVPRHMPPAELSLAREGALGRLRPGVTLDELREDLGGNAATVALTSSMPFQRDDPADWITATPYREALLSMRSGVQAEDIRPAVLLMLAASAFLLLLACFNVANILLASTVARSRELAVRCSIGAGRGRIVRQLLAEALVLSAAGYLVGLGIAWGGVEALKLLAPADVPRIDEVQLNGTVLGVSALLSIASGLFFGVVPAFRLSGAHLGTPLSAGAWSSRSGLRGDRIVAGLVTAQVATSLVMLTAAGLTVRSFANLLLQDVGFEQEDLWTARLAIPNAPPYHEDLGIPYEGTTSGWILRTDEWKTVSRRLVERLAADTRIAEAGAAIGLPLSGGYPGRHASFEANVNYIEPGFFDVLRVTMVAGRAITADDARSDAPLVAVVNDVLAERYWPGEEAVGKTFQRTRYSRHTPDGEEPEDYHIVGVVGRIQELELGEPPTPSVFLARSQLQDTVPAFVRLGNLTLFVRPAQGAESEAGPAIMDAVRTVAPDLRLTALRPMSDVMDRWVRTPRFYAFLLASFAVIGLLLTAAGIGGVVAHTVGRAKREISIRIALGGRPATVVRSLVKRVLVLTSAGILVGLVGALVVGRLISSRLYEVEPMDPLALGAGAALVLVMATVSAWLPTRRVAHADPLEALKAE